MEVFMKRILILILLLPFVLVTQSYGSDIEARLKALEDIIENQQKTIEKQQQEINELKGTQVAREVKPVVAEAIPKEVVGPIKSKELGMAYPTSPIDKKYSEMPKPLEVYSFSQSKFVPDISFILDGSYVGRNLNDETLSNLRVPELIPPGIKSK